MFDWHTSKGIESQRGPERRETADDDTRYSVHWCFADRTAEGFAAEFHSSVISYDGWLVRRANAAATQLDDAAKHIKAFFVDRSWADVSAKCSKFPSNRFKSGHDGQLL